MEQYGACVQPLYGNYGCLEASMQTGQTTPSCLANLAKLSTVTFLFLSRHPAFRCLLQGYAGVKWNNTNDPAHHFFWLVSIFFL
jgi:hypothetical protein